MIEFNATFIVAMLSFIVFIIIMNAIFYNPILNIIRKRENYIESNYNESDKFAKTAQELNSEYELKLDEAKEEGRYNAAVSLDAAQKTAFARIQNAKEDSKKRIQEQKESLLKEKENLCNSVKIDEIAQSIVEKLTQGIK